MRIEFFDRLRNADEALCDAMEADIRGVAAKLGIKTELPIERPERITTSATHCRDAPGRYRAELPQPTGCWTPD
jgi:hypothetical protein